MNKSLEILKLLDDITNNKKKYEGMYGKALRRDKRQLKGLINRQITDFNKLVDFKSIKHL